MMHKARRSVASALILSLLASLTPGDARANLARAALGGQARAGAPAVLPATGFASAGPVALSAAIPSLSPSLPVGGVVLSAPADAPQAPAPDAASRPAPVAQPAAAAETPSASPAAPAAEAAPAGRFNVFAGLKSLLARSMPKAGLTPDLDKGLDRVFDGVSARPEGAPATLLSADGAVARWTLRRYEKHVEKRLRHGDEFGGPKPLGPTTRGQRAAYGLKWGLNMVGIVALYDLALRPVLAAVAWPALLGDGLLESFGRIALLAKLGPNEIVNALSLAPASFLGLPLLVAGVALFTAKPLAKALSSFDVLSRFATPVKALVYGGAAVAVLLTFAAAPGGFLGMSLPVMVAMEEVSYRVFSFLPAFVLMALTRPVMHWLADQLDKLPNHAGVRGMVQKVMRFIGGTFAWYAYPLAAVLSSMSFAAAHFGAWGVDPYVFFVQFTLGMVLTRLAYKTEGLTASIVAHLTFNLAMFGGPLLFALGLPGASTTYGILASIGGMTYLLYNYLAYRKDQAQAKKGLFSAGKALSVALLAGLLGLGAVSQTGTLPETARWNASGPAVSLVQDAAGHGALPAAAAPAATPASAAAEAKEARADVVARIAPSVFRVRTNTGSGTGFILSPQGLAVSNAHVTGATPVGGFVKVEIPGAPPLRAKVLAVNHDKDIALLQLPRHPSGSWRALPVAQTAPRPGEETIAIGYPMGLDQTVTHGIVSGMGRHMNLYVAHIQTDAPINPGNSGGPLFNEKGEVIGMNTMIVSRSGGSIGLGFAIVAPDLSRAVAQYAAMRNIDSGRIGVAINLSDPLKPEAGLKIEYVYDGSGAEKAGLQRGDLLVAVGEQALAMPAEMSAQAMAAALAKTMPGQKLTVVVLRGERRVSVEVVVDAKTSTPGH